MPAESALRPLNDRVGHLLVRVQIAHGHAQRYRKHPLRLVGGVALRQAAGHFIGQFRHARKGHRQGAVRVQRVQLCGGGAQQRFLILPPHPVGAEGGVQRKALHRQQRRGQCGGGQPGTVLHRQPAHKGHKHRKALAGAGHLAAGALQNAHGEHRQQQSCRQHAAAVAPAADSRPHHQTQTGQQHQRQRRHRQCPRPVIAQKFPQKDAQRLGRTAPARPVDGLGGGAVAAGDAQRKAQRPGQPRPQHKPRGQRPQPPHQRQRPPVPAAAGLGGKGGVGEQQHCHKGQPCLRHGFVAAQRERQTHAPRQRGRHAAALQNVPHTQRKGCRGQQQPEGGGDLIGIGEGLPMEGKQQQPARQQQRPAGGGGAVRGGVHRRGQHHPRQRKADGGEQLRPEGLAVQNTGQAQQVLGHPVLQQKDPAHVGVDGEVVNAHRAAGHGIPVPARRQRSKPRPQGGALCQRAQLVSGHGGGPPRFRPQCRWGGA